MFREFFVATAAAVVGGIVLAGLAWFVGRSHFIREWLKQRPWAIAGLVGFATSALSLAAALVSINIFYRSPEPKTPEIVVSVIPEADDKAAGQPSFLTTAASNKLCVFNKIVKNRGGDWAGDAIIIRQKDHWEAFSSNALSSSATCYAFSVK